MFDLPPGYSAIDAFLFGYLSLTQVGADVRVSVDLDGAAGSLSAVPIATLTGVSLSSIQTYQFVVADPGTLPDDPGRAVATNDTFTVTEASGAALRGNVMHGANPDHDLQGSELAVVAVNGNMGSVGTFTTLPSGAKVKINADGSIYFDTAGKFEWLPAGGTTSVSFNYTITDFFSTSATGTVTVNITGSNDKPVVASPLSATLQDAAQPLAINLLSGASDIDLGAVLSVTNVTGLGNGMTLNGSTLTVDPSAYRYLAAGEQQQVTVSYRVTDENGAFAAQTLSLTLTGTNDAPTVAAALHAETQEDTGILSLNLITGASDIDQNASLSISNVTGLVDGLSLSGSTLRVNSSHAAFQSLNAGEQRVITVGYSVVDEHGASVQQTATVTITGSAEQTVTASISTNEDAAPFTVNLLNGAPSGATISALAELPPGLAVVNGVLTVNPTHAAFQSLAQDEQLSIAVTYDVVSAGGSSSRMCSPSVTGTNDAPVVTVLLRTSRRRMTLLPSHSTSWQRRLTSTQARSFRFRILKDWSGASPYQTAY